jgi:transcription elongation regulator 1
MESPAWLPQREVKPPPTATESGVAAATPPPENSAGNNAHSSYSSPAPTFTYNVTPNMSSGAVSTCIYLSIPFQPRFSYY